MTEERLDFADTEQFDFVCEWSVLCNNISSGIGEFQWNETRQQRGLEE
jgi:hypothetical protein